MLAYACESHRTYRHSSALPSDAALRRIFEEEPATTMIELADYYGCSTKLVSRRLRSAGITPANPHRKLPPDDELRPLLVAASRTGYRPLKELFGVSAAALSRAKSRLGVVWPQDSNRMAA